MVVVRVVLITMVLGILYMGAFAVAIFGFELPLLGYTKPSGFFWAVHEFIFAVFYGILFFLRCIPRCRNRVPARGAFWVYAVLLFVFHAVAGGGYMLRAVESGALSYWSVGKLAIGWFLSSLLSHLSLLCSLVSVTNALYLSSFTWLLYFAFLWRFLHTAHENKTRLQVYYDDDDYLDNTDYSSVGSEYQLMDDDLLDTPNNSYTPAYARAWAVRKNSVNADGDLVGLDEPHDYSPK